MLILEINQSLYLYVQYNIIDCYCHLSLYAGCINVLFYSIKVQNILFTLSL